MAPGSALAGTLDQQQTDTSGFQFYLYSAVSPAQTFTAGTTGDLDQVDLHFSADGTPTVPLSIEIRSVSAGAPSNSVLASTTVPASSISAPGFLPIHFATPVPVTAGTQYAIVALSSTDFANKYNWKSSSLPDPYAGGAAFTAAPPTGSWMGTPNDLAFKTYVAPRAGPTGRRAAALKKCKKKHSKKKRNKCRKKARKLPA
jgi:hypothetical protein